MATIEEENVWPKIGDVYFTFDLDLKNLSIFPIAIMWDNDMADRLNQNFGEVFRTEAECRAEIDARQVIAELKQCEGARGFVSGQENYGINASIIDGTVNVAPLPIYFNTAGLAQAAIDKVGAGRCLRAAKWLHCWEAA